MCLERCETNTRAWGPQILFPGRGLEQTLEGRRKGGVEQRHAEEDLDGEGYCLLECLGGEVREEVRQERRVIGNNGQG